MKIQWRNASKDKVETYKAVDFRILSQKLMESQGARKIMAWTRMKLSVSEV